jgi:hypothetical protein
MGISKIRMPKPKPSGVGFTTFGAHTRVRLAGPSLPYQKQNPRFLNFLNISNNQWVSSKLNPWVPFNLHVTNPYPMVLSLNVANPYYVSVTKPPEKYYNNNLIQFNLI